MREIDFCKGQLPYVNAELETILCLGKGQKLTVNSIYKKLEISLSSNETSLGSSIQGISRTLSNMTGLYTPDWHKVAEQIQMVKSLAAKTLEYKDELKDDDLLKKLIKNTFSIGDKLNELAENTYASNDDAKKKFLELSRSFSNLVKSSKELLEQKNNDEADIDGIKFQIVNDGIDCSDET